MTETTVMLTEYSEPKMTEEDYKTKFPIGSKWKTRGGDIAEVIYHNDGSYSRAIVVVRLKDGVPIGLYNNGDCFDDGQSVLDLIEPYVEPKRGFGYFNVYDNGCMAACIRETRLEADQSAAKGRIACIRVEWTEGQYDE